MNKRREGGKIVGVARYVGPLHFTGPEEVRLSPAPLLPRGTYQSSIYIRSSTAVFFMGWKAVQSRKQLRGGRTRGEAAVRRPTAGSDRSARRSRDPGRQQLVGRGQAAILGHSCLSFSRRPLCQRGRVHRSSQA